jgi:O-acetyl-ADP-ribose deacetylase (regulator of RNase III)
MVKMMEGNIFNSSANFIVNNVTCEGDMNNDVLEFCPYAKSECLKFIRHCNKRNESVLGAAQYVPVDSWALIMCDTINNEKIDAYDKNYKYIVNLFGINDEGKADYKALKHGFYDIKNKAKSIGAKIAIPYDIGGKQRDKIIELIYKVFKDEVIVEVYK